MNNHRSTIRTACMEDAGRIVDVKRQLHFNHLPGGAASGGFLLETDIETCRRHIAHDYCLVAERDRQIIGYGLVLKDGTFKRSEIWQKRHQVNWAIDVGIHESSTFCYFDQLGFVGSNSRDAVKLAFIIVTLAFEKGAEYLIATTVREPINNRAALPFIFEGTGVLAGHASTEYPEIGAVKSDIYIIEAEAFERKIKLYKLYPYLWEHYLRFKANGPTNPDSAQRE